MIYKFLLLFCLLSFYLTIDEVNLKGGDEFNNIQKVLAKTFPKDTSVQGLTSFFQKGKIEINVIMEILNKSDKDKADKLDNSDYNQFIKDVYSKWDFISDGYTSTDDKTHYDSKKEGEVCKDYCFFYNQYLRYAFIPKDDKEHAKVFHLHVKFESIPLIVTIDRQKCWKTFLLITKCENEKVEVMKNPTVTAFKAILNYVNKVINSDNFKIFLEQIEFIKDRSMFVNSDVISK